MSDPRLPRVYKSGTKVSSDMRGRYPCTHEHDVHADGGQPVHTRADEAEGGGAVDKVECTRKYVRTPSYQALVSEVYGADEMLRK
jgi:hypothetical protein